MFKSHNGFYCQKKIEFKISCFQKSVLFQGLTTDKPSSETWVYRNYYNNSSVQMMQCCLTSKNNKTCMYLSTDPCSLASMSIPKTIHLNGYNVCVFICFKLEIFLGRVKTALQQFTWQNWRSLRKIESLKDSVSLLSQVNAKQIHRVYCIWFKNIHAVFVKLLNWVGLHKLKDLCSIYWCLHLCMEETIRKKKMHFQRL